MARGKDYNWDQTLNKWSRDRSTGAALRKGFAFIQQQQGKPCRAGE